MNRKERRRLGLSAAPPDAALDAAFQHHRTGNLPTAERLYRKILRETPSNHDALRLLGEILVDRRQLSEAITILRRLTELQPQNFLSHYSLGNAYRLAGRLDEAVTSYEASCALNPDFHGALHGLGAAFRAAEREREAAACFQRAILVKPNWALAWSDLGAVLAILGDLQHAEEAFIKALTLDPSLTDLRFRLAAIRPDAASADDIRALEAKAADQATEPASRIDTLFTLGRLADNAGAYDRAFACVSQANAQLRAMHAGAGLAYDRSKLTRDIDQLIQNFGRTFFENWSGIGDPAETPVFVVGMPRSGSSLFEQIAASHSRVQGAGECTFVGAIANAIGPTPAGWSPDNIRAAAVGYLNQLSSKAGHADRIIDKMPDNVFHLGLIAAMFPNARVIFCDRHIADTCLSCFFQRFSNPYLFDTDITDTAHRFRETARLIRHWQMVLPLRMMILSYDSLIQDFSAEAKRLIEFLGLPWEQNCAAFHQTQRPVRTASWSQVRQPLYKNSSGKWRFYRTHLSSLLPSDELI